MNLRGSLLQLGAQLTDQEEANAFSGVVLISRNGERIFERSYGTASRRWNIPVTVDTRFDLASVTKLFTSVAVLQLVDAGRLGLDQKLSTLLDLTGTTLSGDITLRHLLTHTSGIADDADEEAGESYEALWEDKPNYSVTQTMDFLPQFAHKPPNFEPGAGCRYCNCGYILAGLVLEHVTGTGYREHIKSQLFGPAGMTSSGFFHMRDAVPNVAEGWDPVPDDDGGITGWRQNIFSHPPIGSPDGGAHCTAADLVRFMDKLRAGELLSPGLTQTFFTPQVKHHQKDDGGSIHYGFGLEFEVDDGGGIRSFYKDGINAGASALLRHYPATGITVAVLSNSEDGAWRPARLLDETVHAGR